MGNTQPRHRTLFYQQEMVPKHHRLLPLTIYGTSHIREILYMDLLGGIKINEYDPKALLLELDDITKIAGKYNHKIFSKYLEWIERPLISIQMFICENYQDFNFS